MIEVRARRQYVTKTQEILRLIGRPDWSASWLAGSTSNWLVDLLSFDRPEDTREHRDERSGNNTEQIHDVPPGFLRDCHNSYSHTQSRTMNEALRMSAYFGYWCVCAKQVATLSPRY